jgi:MATE family multidrug resistance protein
MAKDEIDFQSEDTHYDSEWQMKEKLCKYLRNISMLTFPVILFYLCIYLQQTINLIFLARISKPENKEYVIEAIGISHLYINITILSVFIGLLMGFDILGARAHGARDFKLLGLYYHRAMIVALVYNITMVIIHYFTAVRVLSLFSISPNILEYINSYMQTCLFFVIPDVIFSANFRLINILSKSYVNLIILFTTICLHPLWCYLLIVVLDMGVSGAGLCLVISQTLNALGGVFYILYFKPNPESVFFFTWESFKGIGSYLEVALPSALLICVEWWALDLQALIALWVSDDDYAAHVLILAIVVDLNTISIGFSVTNLLFIGKLISNSTITKTKRYVKLIFFFGLFIMITCALFIWLFGPQIIHIFLKEGEVDSVVQKAITVMKYLFIVNVLDYTQFNLARILGAFGKQFLACVVAIINFYLIQTSLSIFLGKYLGMGVIGVWIGLGIGFLLSSIFYFIILLKLDYKKIQDDILLELESEKKIDPEENEELLINTSTENSYLNSN